MSMSEKERTTISVLQMSDTILYVISSSSGISIEGDYLLDLINVHCLAPNLIYSVVSAVNDDSISTTSSRLSTTRNLERFLEKRFFVIASDRLDETPFSFASTQIRQCQIDTIGYGTRWATASEEINRTEISSTDEEMFETLPLCSVDFL